MLEHALVYADQGLRIFPCHYPIGSGCSCKRKESCPNIGKHPIEQGWQASASSERYRVEKLWTLHPEANIGLLTGAANQMDVLDVDPKHGGMRSLIELPEQLPDTLTAKTGSGGFHYFFKHVPGLKNNNNGKIKPGLDFRTTGGFVVAPPSIHISGNRYEWLALDPPAPVPAWLEAAMRAQDQGARSKQRYKEEDWKQLALGQDPGGRHDAIVRVASLLLGSGKVRSKHLAIALIHGFNAVCCDPPKPEEEVTSIIKWIARKHARGGQDN
jgi:putative DNA primase/helicase